MLIKMNDLICFLNNALSRFLRLHVFNRSRSNPFHISSFHAEVAALGRRASQRPLADKLAVMMMPRIMAVTLRCNASMAVEVFPKKSFANAMETAAATNWLGMGG